MLLRRILLLSALNFLYNMLHLFGLDYFDVSSEAFAMSMTVVVMPLVLFIARRKVKPQVLLSAGIVLVGIVFVVVRHMEWFQLPGFGILCAGCVLQAIIIYSTQIIFTIVLGIAMPPGAAETISPTLLILFGCVCIVLGNIIEIVDIGALAWRMRAGKQDVSSTADDASHKTRTEHHESSTEPENATDLLGDWVDDDMARRALPRIKSKLMRKVVPLAALLFGIPSNMMVQGEPGFRPFTPPKLKRGSSSTGQEDCERRWRDQSGHVVADSGRFRIGVNPQTFDTTLLHLGQLSRFRQVKRLSAYNQRCTFPHRLM